MTHHFPKEPRETSSPTAGGESRKLSEVASAKAESALSGQKSQLVQQIHSTAEAIHESAGRLHEKNLSTAASYTDRMADRLNEVADFIQDRSIGQIADEIGGLARRQPVYAMTGAFALGLLAARFFKASGRRRTDIGHNGDRMYQGSMEDYGSAYRRVPEAPVSVGSPTPGPEI